MANAGDKITAEVTKAKTKSNDRRKQEEAEFKECLNRVASTPDGVFVLNRIMYSCGYRTSSLVSRDGCLDRDGLCFNEGRRSVWLDLQARIATRHLKKIEFLRGK